jgi:hypothetical protein
MWRVGRVGRGGAPAMSDDRPASGQPPVVLVADTLELVEVLDAP